MRSIRSCSKWLGVIGIAALLLIVVTSDLAAQVL